MTAAGPGSRRSTAIRLSLHVLAATVWVGGQFTLAGLVPTARGLGEGAPKALARAFGRIQWPAYGVLVVTGLWNVSAVHAGQPQAWQAVLGVKIVVVVARRPGGLPPHPGRPPGGASPSGAPSPPCRRWRPWSWGSSWPADLRRDRAQVGRYRRVSPATSRSNLWEATPLIERRSQKRDGTHARVLAEIFGVDGIIIILVVVVVLFGSTQIPKLARSLGSAQSEFKKGLDEGKKGETTDTGSDKATVGQGRRRTVAASGIDLRSRRRRSGHRPRASARRAGARSPSACTSCSSTSSPGRSPWCPCTSAAATCFSPPRCLSRSWPHRPGPARDRPGVRARLHAALDIVAGILPSPHRRRPGPTARDASGSWPSSSWPWRGCAWPR